jgi:hypothetical protein
MKELKDLAARWLEEAETLDRYRDERGGSLCRMLAAELQAALANHEREVLTLAQASQVSGYTADHLRHLISEGAIPNAGIKGSPRVKRGDVPMKPGERAPDDFDPAAEAGKILRMVKGKEDAAGWT